MVNRTAAALFAASFLALQCAPMPASAENAMGYQLLSAQQAAGLPRRGGALGLDVGPGQRIVSGGMDFELLRVNGVRRGSPGAQAGFDVGDQIIAADGQVFPAVAAFAAYVGSVQPGRQITVDYIPVGGGPQQAQRVAVTVGAGGQATPGTPVQQQPVQQQPVQQDDADRSTGLSTGAKLAIGAGAAALFGCYQLGCFSRSQPEPGVGQRQR